MVCITYSIKRCFSPCSQFSANLMYLVFYCLTRLSDIILLNKEDSCTARMNAMQLPKEIILCNGSSNLSFFSLIFLLSDVYFYSVILFEKENEKRTLLFLETFQYVAGAEGLDERYAASPSKDHFMVPANNIVATVLEMWYWSVIYFSVTNLGLGPHEWTQILINTI